MSGQLPVVQGRHRRRGAEGSRHPLGSHLPSRARSASPSAAPSARPSSARRSTTSRPSSAASRPTRPRTRRDGLLRERWGAALGGPNHALLERRQRRDRHRRCASGLLVAGGGHAGHPARRRARPSCCTTETSFASRWTAPDADAVFNGSGGRNGGGRRGSVRARRRHGASPARRQRPRADGAVLGRRLRRHRQRHGHRGRRCHQRGDRRRARDPPGGIVRLASDTEGTASRVQVTGGTANAVLAFPGAASVGGGNVANLRAVEVAEVKAVVEAAIPTVTVDAGVGGVLDIRTVATGPGASVQAAADGGRVRARQRPPTPARGLGHRQLRARRGQGPGAYANRVEADTRNATNGSPSAFDLLVVEDGAYRESFPNLSMTRATGALRREHRQRRAQRLRVRARHRPTPRRRAHPAAPDRGARGRQRRPVGLDDNDSSAASPPRRAFTRSTRCRSCPCCPRARRATPAVHNAMVRYCEVDRDGAVFAVLDPPANQSATDIVTYVATTAALEQLSEFGAIYWPRVKVLNPAKSVFGSAEQLVVPPSGIVAGVFARTDSAQPGGVTIRPPASRRAACSACSASRPTRFRGEQARPRLPAPHQPAHHGPLACRATSTARARSRATELPYVAERRGVIFIERSSEQAPVRAAQEQHRGTARAGAAPSRRSARADEQRRLPRQDAEHRVLRRRERAAQHADGHLRRQAHRPRGPRHQQARGVHHPPHQPGHARARGRARGRRG